jgi:hypothetical protein
MVASTLKKISRAYQFRALEKVIIIIIVTQHCKSATAITTLVPWHRPKNISPSPPPSIFSFSLPRHVHAAAPPACTGRHPEARESEPRTQGKARRGRKASAGERVRSGDANPAPTRTFLYMGDKGAFGNEKRLKQYYAVLSASRSSLGESCVAGLLWSIGWSHCIASRFRTWSVVLVHQPVHNNNTGSLSVGCSGCVGS